MSPLVLSVQAPGMLTTVQDIGRWGGQGQGMPVAGAMDGQAFRMGNIIVGNQEEDSGLEVTLMGPKLLVAEGEGVAAVTGAELGFQVNGKAVANWTAVEIGEGDVLSFSGPQAGCRAYLCLSGGIDVPMVLGSRSTYTRAKVGGVEGRALKKGDRLLCGEAAPLWRRCSGFVCPEELRPRYEPGAPLRVIPGPQDDHFPPKGRETFYGSEYTISNSADRMGYRLDGPVIEHDGAADIISDAIPLGAVQVPGHGQPIVMLADRQTTGGYTKIGVVCSVDMAALSQRLPGEKVRFVPVALKDALTIVREAGQKRQKLLELRAAWRSRPAPGVLPAEEITVPVTKGEALLHLEGKAHRVTWEEIKEE